MIVRYLKSNHQIYDIEKCTKQESPMGTLQLGKVDVSTFGGDGEDLKVNMTFPKASLAWLKLRLWLRRMRQRKETTSSSTSSCKICSSPHHPSPITLLLTPKKSLHAHDALDLRCWMCFSTDGRFLCPLVALRASLLLVDSHSSAHMHSHQF